MLCYWYVVLIFLVDGISMMGDGYINVFCEWVVYIGMLRL